MSSFLLVCRPCAACGCVEQGVRVSLPRSLLCCPPSSRSHLGQAVAAACRVARHSRCGGRCAYAAGCGLLTLSSFAASRVVSSLSSSFPLPFRRTRHARMCPRCSAICCRHCVVGGTFHCYHFHDSVLSFLFLRQNSAINKRGFNNSLRDSRKIFTEDGSVTRSNGATGSLSAENGTC